MSGKLEEARQIINAIDAQMAELFEKRMKAVEQVYAYKREFGLPILDQQRENAVIEKNAALIADDVIREYYIEWLRHLMSVSRDYQHRMQESECV